MVSEQIDRIKREYTDQYVVVDARRPELARFQGVVGRVKTVNMSGRALVEFVDFHKNIGWYDIDIDFLKVVDKPAATASPAKERAKPAVKKPVAAPRAASAKKLSPLEMARMQGAAKKKGETAPAAAQAASPTPPAAAKGERGKRSVAEILAAARAEKGAGAAKKPGKPASAESAATSTAPANPPAGKNTKMSVAEILAAARAEKGGSAEGTPAKAAPPTSSPAQAPAGKKMSVAEILAAARAEKGTPPGGTATAASDAATASAGAAATEAAAGEPPSGTQDAETAPAPKAKPSGKVDRASMSVADVIAWCREHDA